MSRVECASCAFCTCDQACAWCQLYRPNGEGQHRLSDTAIADECVCDMPKHCPACSHCVCDSTATAEDIAADIRVLPGVDDLRIRRHATLPRPHIARSWDSARGDKIVIYLDHPGQPPSTITVKVNDPNLLSPVLLALPDEWNEFVRKWNIAASNNVAELTSSYDPRRNRALNICEPLALAYAERFLADTRAAAKYGVDLDHVVQVRSRLIMALIMSDAWGQCPSSLVFRFPPEQSGALSHLHLVAPPRDKGAPLIFDLSHCDQCSDPVWLAQTLANELAGVPGVLFASDTPPAVQDVVAMLPDSILDLAAEHELPVWMLTALCGVISLHNPSDKIGMPMEMVEAVVLLLTSSVPPDVTADGPSGSKVKQKIDRMWANARESVLDLCTIMHGLSHNDDEVAEALAGGWQETRDQVRETLRLWSDVSEQGNLSVLGTRVVSDPDVDEHAGDDLAAEDLPVEGADEEDVAEEDEDSPASGKAALDLILTDVLCAKLAQAYMARREILLWQNELDSPDEDTADLSVLKKRKAALQASLKARKARATRQQQVIEAADRLRDYVTQPPSRTDRPSFR